MKTMLDKCAVAGDITQAIDRRGAWSCALTVIGGTESTAVKLQSCETADGIFEDFKTLIPSADASANQYKGFVVDISGAGNFIKVVGATMATCVLGDCDADVKKVAIKAGEVPSGGGATAYAWMANGVPIYFPISVAPIDKADYLEKCKMGGSCQTETAAFVINSSYASNDDEYSRISDSKFSIVYEDGEETITTTFTRYALADFTLW